jgi:hypothetical protein
MKNEGVSMALKEMFSMERGGKDSSGTMKEKEERTTRGGEDGGSGTVKNKHNHDRDHDRDHQPGINGEFLIETPGVGSVFGSTIGKKRQSKEVLTTIKIHPLLKNERKRNKSIM